MPDSKEDFVEEAVVVAEVVVVAEEEAPTPTLPILVPYLKPQLMVRLTKAEYTLTKNLINSIKTSVIKLWISINSVKATRIKNSTLVQIL